ncbi:tryptophan 2,3-dioxygenase family protein [Streptomyces sp. NBC_01669]|uniref:tryptophan 2,3-dioxygenase family protein n=1 Tax=Streptomyces sp. NBC_01669 TaxID=2975909 RepID=UPI002253AD77|nr:tryptophan 2,3-dioxygenase family protein [Streptomyces sp. NBC_01669]MCX4538232.1 tryptophan 2,3-dioxygenase family protein [Streptomyces sp. NBC_01669]
MGGTAYNEYLKTDVLHALQVQVTEDEGERSFLVVCQVQELYFALITHDIDAAAGHLRANRAFDATAALRRAASHFAGLNASWTSLSWMLPADFQAIKQGMTSVHGRSSSLQSWKYRQLLFRLGLKDADLAEEVRGMPEQYAELQEAYQAPSVYEDALAMARRRGHDLPEKKAAPDGNAEDGLDPAVVTFWTTIFLSGKPEHADLFNLAHSFIAVAEGLAEYRNLHYLTTSRTLGARPAYFGTSGTAWLLPTLQQMPFPELWATRTGEE